MSGETLSWSMIAQFTGGVLRGNDAPVKGLFQVDSRKVRPGDVFVALPGVSSDGHDYLDKAFSMGASGAIVRVDKMSPSCIHERLILVKDVEASLIAMARKRLSEVPRVLGVTGSVGKTTVREMIAVAVEDEISRVYRARSSHNTVIGCALTIAEMPLRTSVLILEMGTNHPGEIAEMVGLFPIHLAVITKVAPAHLEGLKDIDGVLKAKMEILGSSSLERVILNGDDPFIMNGVMSAKGKNSWSIVPVGAGPSCTFSILSCSFEWADLPLVTLKLAWGSSFKGKSWLIRARLLGEHNALLLGLAWSAAVSLGVDPDKAAERLSHFNPCDGRGVLKDINGITVLDESYNANPASMEAALSSIALSPFQKDRRFLVLGSMGELGTDSDRMHRSLLDRAMDVGRVFLFGDKWPKDLVSWTDIDLLATHLKSLLFPGDLLLLKGSRVNGLERLLEILQ